MFGISKSQNSWVYFDSKCSKAEDFFKASVCKEFIDQFKSDGIPIIGQS